MDRQLPGRWPMLRTAPRLVAVFVAAAFLLLYLQCGGTASQPAAPQPTPTPAPAPAPAPAPSTPQPVTVGVEVFKDGLNFPVKLAFAPDGRLFFTQKGGLVRILQNGQVLEPPFVTLRVEAEGERGVLGIAFDPDFGTNHFIYVFYSDPSGVNRVVRFTDSNNVGTNEAVIVEGIPHSHFHNGGNIEFDRTGHLFVSTGDALNPANSQDPNSRHGKILRYNRDGSIPPDNPLGSGNPVFALGLRNPFDFAFHPQSGVMYVSENGPECDDEADRIVPGGNYGWRPNYPCGDTDPHFIAPIARYSPPVVPTGIMFYTGDRFPQFTGHVLLAQFGDGKIRHLVVDDANNGKVSKDEIIVNGGFGKLIDMVQGPDGLIYFNNDHAILRLVPR